MSRSLVFFCCLFLTSCAPPRATSTKPAPEPTPPAARVNAAEVSPVALFEAYADDVDAGDKRYKGRLLKVQGTIKSGDTFGGKPCILLYLPLYQNKPVIRCVFEPADQAEVDRLKSGSIVRVRGVCVGVKGDDGKGDHVTLEQCDYIGTGSN